MKLKTMKHLALCAALLMLTLSVGTVLASAEVNGLPPVPWTPGCYAGADGESFAPVGEIEIEWYPYIGEKLKLTDGDLTDWKEHGITPHVITPDNMISWVGGENGVPDPGMPEGWQITGYYVADSFGLYMAFDVVDPDHVYCQSTTAYDGDAIQLGVDFGGKLGEILQKDPDRMVSLKNIFYSFSCRSDGAPLEIMRQESDQDTLLTEANGDGIKGAARRTPNGWSAELAFSWQLLYDDYAWKAWESDSKIYVGSSENIPLKLGFCLTYINRSSDGNLPITWAACTAQGYEVEENTPGVSWTPYDNGISLYLPCEPDMVLDCGGIVVMGKGCETAPTYDCTETVPPDEYVTVPDMWVESIPDEWLESLPITDVTIPGEWLETAESVADALPDETLADGISDDEIQAILAKYGCSTTLGVSALAVLLVAAAAAAVLRRKD